MTINVAVTPGRVRACVRRGVDATIAGLGLLLALPIMAVVALLIQIESRGPALVRDPRVGRNGVEFSLFMFRTTRVGPDGHRCPTRIGEFARRTSIDELPVLWNVLRGDLAFVGPPAATPSEDLRPDVPGHPEVPSERPGVSGLWRTSAESKAS